MARRQPYPDQLVFCSGSKIPAVRTEANTANVQIPILVHGLVLQEGNLLSGIYFKYLCRAIAACSDISAIMTEPNTANDTFMYQMMYKVDVKHPLHLWIEDSKPVCPFDSQIVWKLLWIKIGKGIADSRPISLRLSWRSWARNLRGLPGVRIRCLRS